MGKKLNINYQEWSRERLVNPTATYHKDKVLKPSKQMALSDD